MVDFTTEFYELIRSEPVGFLHPPRFVVGRNAISAYAVLPVVCGNITAAGPADDRRFDTPQRFQYVRTEAVLIGKRRGCIKHPAVDLPMKVLQKMAIEHSIRLTDDVVSATYDFHVISFRCRSVSECICGGDTLRFGSDGGKERSSITFKASGTFQSPLRTAIGHSDSDVSQNRTLSSSASSSALATLLPEKIGTTFPFVITSRRSSRNCLPSDSVTVGASGS